MGVWRSCLPVSRLAHAIGVSASATLTSGLLLVIFVSVCQAQPVITTVAGTDWLFPGDGRPAIEAPLGGLAGMGRG